MATVAVVRDDGTVVDITARVEKIFQNMGQWPADWEDWTGDEVALQVLLVGKELGLEGFDARAAVALAQAERRALDRAQREAERERLALLQLEREERRRREWPAVSAKLHEIAGALAARIDPRDGV